ncbi:MAG: ComF family protein [Nevskiaceae bacterium]|nr:ComF family protein [Nevskiaceae bacterium]
MKAAIQALTSRIAPPVCVLCGGPGQIGDEVWGLDLCEHCEAACPADDAAETLPSGEPVRALFLFRPPVDRLIVQLKFRLDPAPSRVLAMLLARRLRAEPLRPPPCLIPMPLHPRRLRERGFNQCELIGRQLGRRLGLRVCTDLLERRRHTRAQSDLAAAARTANVAGAFGLRPGVGLRDGVALPRRVALLDDVITTGNTLSEAARVLREAGVAHLEAWACARTPQDARG